MRKRNIQDISSAVLDRFFVRADVYGVYYSQGAGKKARGSTAKEGISAERFRTHLQGQLCIGAHSTAPDNTCRWGCVDIDASKSAKESYLAGDDGSLRGEKVTLKDTAFEIAGELSDSGLCPLVEDSVGGYHVWVFFGEPVPAGRVREFLLNYVPRGTEVFPKQSELKPGQVGNWVRLPGRYHSTGDYSHIWTGEQWVSLSSLASWETILTWPDSPPPAPVSQPRDIETQGAGERGGTLTPTDQEILDRLRSARNADKFRRLFEGGWESSEYKSQSEADAALCSLIAFYTQDHSQIDRIYRQSELYLNPKYADNNREKWAREDYRERTIANAISCRTEFFRDTEGGGELPRWIERGAQGKLKINPAKAANDFVAEQGGNLIHAKESFWEFRGGVWLLTPDREVRGKIESFLSVIEGLPRKSIVEDVFYLVSHNDNVLRGSGFSFNRWPHLLNFRNGVLDTSDLTLREHDKELYQTIQFPYEYDPAETCPLWTRFLASLCLSVETQARLQEWVGYCLVPDTRLQRCLYLKGEGSNGKSVFLETVAALLGDAAASVEITELFDRFKVAELQGKLANLCTDIATSKVFSEQFKKVVSGELTTAERKHQHPFQFRPRARFLFSANSFIPTKDRSHGFYRRFDIVEFRRQFSSFEQDRDLPRKLRGELPGILNWAIAGLVRLRKNSWRMTNSEEMEAAKAEFKRESNPLQQFVDEVCNTGADRWVESDHFRACYQDWCVKRGYMPLSEAGLGREMRRLGFHRSRKRLGGGRSYVYQGIDIESS